MNPPVKAAGGRLARRPSGADRIGYSPFSWWTVMNISTRERTPVRVVSRGWRALLLDPLP